MPKCTKCKQDLPLPSFFPIQDALGQNITLNDVLLVIPQITTISRAGVVIKLSEPIPGPPVVLVQSQSDRNSNDWTIDAMNYPFSVEHTRLEGKTGEKTPGVYKLGITYSDLLQNTQRLIAEVKLTEVDST